MIIRQISRKDLDKADKLQEDILNPKDKKRARSLNYIKRHFRKNPSLFAGCYDKDSLVGVVFGYVKRDYVLLGEMAVLKEYRNKKIGKKLLKFFERQTRKTGKKKIILGARNNAEKFFLKNGYKPLLFVQVKGKIKNKDYKIIKKSVKKGITGLIIQIKKYDKKLKEIAKKDFNAIDAIYLFEKRLR